MDEERGIESLKNEERLCNVEEDIVKSLRRKKDNKKMKIFIIKRIKKDYGKKA